MKAGRAQIEKVVHETHHSQEQVFDYLMSQCPNVSKTDQIDCYELLGASFANDKEHYDLDKSYAYLTKVSWN